MKCHWWGSDCSESFGFSNKCQKSCAWSANIGGQKTKSAGNHFLVRFIEKTKSQNVSPRARPQGVESEGVSSNGQTFSTCFWKLFLYSYICNGILNIHLQFYGLISLLNILPSLFVCFQPVVLAGKLSNQNSTEGLFVCNLVRFVHGFTDLLFYSNIWNCDSFGSLAVLLQANNGF